MNLEKLREDLNYLEIQVDCNKKGLEDLRRQLGNGTVLKNGANRVTILPVREMARAFQRKPLEPQQRQARQVAMRRNTALCAQSGPREFPTLITRQNVVSGIQMGPRREKASTVEIQTVIMRTPPSLVTQTIKRPLRSKRRK